VKKQLSPLAVINILVWVVIVAGAVFYLGPAWRSVKIVERLRTVDPAWLAAAFALLLTQYLALFGLWVCILRLLGVARGHTGPLFRAYGLSLLPKYVPGKILGQGIRAKLTVDCGVPVRTAFTSMGWEIALSLGSAVIVACAGLIAGQARGLEGAALWMLRAFIALALVAAVLACLPGWGKRWGEWLDVATARRHRVGILVLIGFYAATWMISTLAHWCLARAIGPLPSGHVLSLLVALCVAWGVGIMSIIAPAGLGVREGILFLFARDWLGNASALVFVSLSRVLAVTIEVCLTAVAAHPRFRRSADGAESPGARQTSRIAPTDAHPGELDQAP